MAGAEIADAVVDEGGLAGDTDPLRDWGRRDFEFDGLIRFGGRGGGTAADAGLGGLGVARDEFIEFGTTRGAGT